MSRAPQANRFGLEELEPRVLLSANLTSLGTAAATGGTHTGHVIEVGLTGGGAAENSLSYQANAGADLFAGLAPSTPIAFAADTATTAGIGASGESADRSEVTGSPVVSGNQNAATNPAAVPAGTPSDAAEVQSTTAVAGAQATAAARVATAQNTLAATGTSNAGAKASELTDTLKGPNAPPTAALVQDLQSYISDLLASATASFSSTEQLGSVSLGGILQLEGVQLTVNATLTNGVWSGTIGISVISATIFPGKSFSGTIATTNSNPAITGTYTITGTTGTYSLTVPSTATLTIRVGEALSITASGVTFGFNPTGSATQTLATISTATVASGQFANLPTATLANFVIRADGFSFDAFSLNSATGSTPGIGNLITAATAALTASNVNVSFGHGTTAASMSGTVGLTLTGLQVFPAGGFVQSQADSVSASYSFANFDGTTATGKLSITVQNFRLRFGDALLLTAGDVVLMPGQMVMATVSTATLSSPQFTGLGTITINNLAIRQDGFSLGSAEWSSNVQVNILGVARVDSVTVTLSNLALVYGTIPSISGGISITVTGAVLFPDIPILNINLGTLTGRFVFGDLRNPFAYLSLSIPSFSFSLGDALTITLPTIEFSPNFANMFRLPDLPDVPTVPFSLPTVNITFPTFSGFPSLSLPNFAFTPTGFRLGDFEITAVSSVNIGGFIAITDLVLAGTNLAVNKTSPFVTGTLSVRFGTVTLFPGSQLITSTFTNLIGSFEFAHATRPGQFKLTADTFTLGIGGQLSLSASNIIITPALATIATIGTANLTFTPLNNLAIAVTNLAIRQDGFSIASASASLSDITLGSLLSLTAPTVTLTNINYVFGGALTGTVGFSTTSARLSLGSAVETTASSLTGSYNLATGRLAVTLDTFSLSLAGFANLTATGASLIYDPASDGSSEMLVGVTGLTVFLGSGSGANRVGVELTGGTLALAVFRTATGVTTYALSARGTVSLVGLPENTLTATGTIEFRKNTAGAITRTVAAGAGSVSLAFTGNEESVMGQGVSISVGGFVSISGNFGFRQFTSGSDSFVAIGATNVNASVAVGGVTLAINGASLGLLIKAGATASATTYALVASGNASLEGVPGLTLSGSGLSVRVRHGLDVSGVTGIPTSVATPGGSVNFNFAGLGSGSTNVTDFQGQITLNIAGFVSITGHFGFQQFTNGSSTYLAVGATGLSIVLGTSTTNLTLANASFGLIIAPGAGSTPTTYALQARGSSNAADTSLNGVPGLTLNGTDLLVRVRRGLDLSGNTNIPSSVQTSGGAVTLNFAGLGSGTSDVTDIQGHLTLAVDGFGSLEGDFGFQAYASGGAQTIAIGASAVTAVLGTATTNLTVTGGTFGLIIRPGVGGAPATYALQATATSASLNGITGLSVSGTSLMVRIRNGLDVATTPGAPATIQTSGADVTLNFAGLGAGTSNVMEVRGNVTVSVDEFVSLSGSFGFQSRTVGSDRYLLIGATDLTATLAAGDVNLRIANASVGVIVKQGTTGSTPTPTTYALIARGSTNPADTTLNGVTGLSVSATNLLVRVRSGLDLSTLPSGLPASIATATGTVNFDFSGLGSGTTAVTDIQGHLTLSIAGFVSLEGDFGFQRYGTGANSFLAIGAANVNAVLGTPGLNVTITNASLGLLIKPTVGTTPGGYALTATGGSVALNGVPELSLSATGLSVKVRQGLDPASLTGAPSSVLVRTATGSSSVALNFAGLGAGNVMALSGNISISIAGFVTLQGDFSFTKETSGDGLTSKILVGASSVTAFIGTADGTAGIRITNASFALVLYRTGTVSTYALKAVAPSIEVVGLPADISLEGAASVAINTTGRVVSETVGGTTLSFTSAANVQSFGGSLTLKIGPASAPTFQLSGDFSFTKIVSGPTTSQTTKLLIGAANVRTATGSAVSADGNTANTFSLSNGTLGLVLINTGGVSQGYALIASATATVATGPAGASATLTIRRNSTTSAQNETIVVGANSVPVIFSDTEKKTGTAPTEFYFQQVILSNASLTVGDLITVTASQGTQTTPVTGATTTALTGVTVTVGDGAQSLFTISAGTANYTSFSAIVTVSAASGAGLPTRSTGTQWELTDKILILTNVSFTIGTYVSFTAQRIEIVHTANTTTNGTTTTTVTNNSFAFTNAVVSFIIDGQTMVSLGGSPRFTHSSTNGFQLQSFTNPVFSFMGGSLPAFPASAPATAQPLAAPGTPSMAAAEPPPTTTTLGPITLIGATLSLENFGFKAAQGQPLGTVTLTADIVFSAANARIGETSSPTHALITTLAARFGVGITFSLLGTSPPSLGATGFSVTAGTLTINVGSFLTLSATNIAINPTAAASADLLYIGSLTTRLHFGAVDISGTASDFAITGSGGFRAGTNFAVSIAMGAGAEGGMAWPTWLPLQSASVTLRWTNFNADPTNFKIMVSASIATTLAGITISGSVTNAVIDPQLLIAGQFPFVSVDSISATLSGTLFGATVTGGFVGGIVRFDSTNAIIDGFGFRVGTNTPASGTITNVFYAGLTAGISVGGVGLTVRLGLSDFGPLEIYVTIGAPVPLGPTGLFLSNFRGGVSFGASFPTITLSNPIAATDALQLRQPGFATPSALTAGQWEAQLRSQVATLKRNGAQVVGLAGFSSLSSTNLLIRAGATLYAVNDAAFRVDADMVFDLSGRFLVLGSATIGNSLSIGVKMFADLSQGNNAKLLFILENPAQPNIAGLPAVYSVFGVATFTNDSNGFRIAVAGRVQLNVLDGLTAYVDATVTLAFTSTSFNITLVNGSFTVPMIQSAPLGTAAGTLTIETVNGTTNVWGGFLLVPNLTGLEGMGIYAGGQVFIKLNTTSVAKTVTLTNGTLNLDPQSFSLFVNGYLDMRPGGQQAFRLEGTLLIQINATSLTIFVQTDLKLGPNPSSPLLTFNANGLVHVQIVQSGSISPGFAAKLQLTSKGTLPAGVAFAVNFLLVVNTTSSEITFTIPSPVPTTPPAPPVPTVMGPDFTSSNPAALVSYEVVTNGVRTLVIPAGAPASGLANYRTWTPSNNSPYLIVIGRGTMTVANSFTFTGTLNITGVVSGGQYVFTLDVNASLALKANGNTVFTFNVSGGMQLSNAGLAASLTVTLQGGLPSGIGFSFDNVTFTLQLNTTGAAVTVGGVSVPAGPNGTFFANVRISGNLKLLNGIVTLNGTFDLTVTGASMTLGIDANITFFNATLRAVGFAGIYYDSNPGMALRIQLSLPGGAQGISPIGSSNFVIKGTFTLEINTSSITRNDQNGVGIAPGFKVAVTNLGVYLFGFNLTGSITITITSAGFGITIHNLNLNLFGLASISISGFYNPNGTFSFTGSAGFQFGDRTFGIGGSISVTISNSGFSASVSGWVAAFGVQINGGGAIVISGSSVDIYVSIYVVLVPEIHINTPAVTVSLPWWLGGGTHTIIPAVNITIPAVIVSGTAHFHLGSTAPAPTVATVQPPPPPPTPPALASVNSGVLKLHVGADVGLRVNSQGTVTGALPAENYTLSVVSTSGNIQTIRVTALGFTQDYTGVSSILVSDTQGGNDTITIADGVIVPVTMTLGSGNNTINTGGGAATITVSGAGTNNITTANNATVTVNGNGSNFISSGAGSTFTINGTGSNRVTTNGGAATITVNASASGPNANNTLSVNSAGSGAVSINVHGSGRNTINVGGGVPTVNLSSTASGQNSVSINTTNATNVTIAGNGNNQLTVLGTTAATLLITGNGANQITTGGGATTLTLRGSGYNQVSTGAGFVTLNDQGTGGTSVVGGPGGGVFIGGLTSSGAAFTTKGASSLSTATNNFSVQLSGYSSYTLNDASLSYGSFTLGLNGVRQVSLTAGSASATNNFTLAGWSYSATLTGAGSNNTMLVSPRAGATSINYTLTNTQLAVAGGLTQTITLSGIQAANLVGAMTGTNTFTVSAWTGSGQLTGPQGTTNTLIATNNVATFTLTDVSFARSSQGTFALNGIQNATITGGDAANTFNTFEVVNGTNNYWSGSATFDGAGGADTYNLNVAGTSTGTFNITDTGSSGTDTLNVSGPRNAFITSTQVRLGTQRANYSGIETLNVNGTAAGLSYYIQSTRAGTATSVLSFAASGQPNTSLITVGSTAGNLPVAAGNVNGIQGALSISGGGTLLIDDTLSNTVKTGTLTPTALTGLGMGSGGITYSGLTQLTLNLGSGGNTLALNDITPATRMIIDGGSSANDTINATFANAFDGRIDLTSFEHGTFATAGNFNGTLNSSGPGHFETITIGSVSGVTGSLVAAGRLTVGSIGTLSVGQDLAGIVTVSGRLANLTVGRDVTGSVSQTGVVTQLTIGRDFTTSGLLTISNTTAALASIGTMNVGGHLAGTLNVSGAVGTQTVGGNLSGTMTVGGTLGTQTITGNLSGTVTVTGAITTQTVGGNLTGTLNANNNLGSLSVTGSITGTVNVAFNATTIVVGGNVSGTVAVQGTLTTLQVTGSVSGTVSQTGTINLLTIGGSLTSTGTITAINPADPTQFSAGAPATQGNIVTMTVGQALAGTLTVSGNVTSLTVGTPSAAGLVSGTVTVRGTLTTLVVNGDVSGTVTQSGTVNVLTITGSLLGTGLIRIFNTADPAAMLANVNTFTVGLDVAGTILVSGRLTKLTVGRDVSGSITEAGVVNELTITGSITATGLITISNPTAALAAIATMSVGGDVAGRVIVSGSVTSLTVQGSITPLTLSSSPATNLSVGGNLDTLTVNGNAAGRVSVTGNVTTGTVRGNVSGVVTIGGNIGTLSVGTATLLSALSGTLTVAGSVTTLTVTGDVSGTATISGHLGTATLGHVSGTIAVTGNITTGNVSGHLSGTVTVQGTLTELRVGGNVSGRVTESGTITLLTIGGSLTSSGVINAVNAAPALGNIVTFTIGVDLAGTVLVSGALTTLQVGNDISGTVTESGIINLLTIGGSLTPSGRINAFNAADPAQVPAGVPATLGNINAMTVGRDLAGEVNVSGALGSLTVGTATFAGSITGTGKVTVQGTLTTLTVTGNIAGAVKESGTIATLTVGGSITSTGTITVLNTADPAQFTAGATLLGNIVTMSVTGAIAGLVTVSGNLATLDAGSISGTVAVKSTLTTLRVVGSVSGAVSESGTINLLTVGGAVTGTITVLHTTDPAQFTTGVTPLGNIVTMTVTGDISGTVSVSGNVTTLNAGSITGTVAVKNTLTTLQVGGNVSGTVSESGTITLLAIGGSLTSSGKVLVAHTSDPAQVPATPQATFGNITTMTVGQTLAGLLSVTGDVSSLTVGTPAAAGLLSGIVTVKGTLTTLLVNGSVSGSVTESGTIASLTITGSLTSTGLIKAYNSADPLQVPATPAATLANITTMIVGGDVAGTVTVSGTFMTLEVAGNVTVTGVVAVQGMLHTVRVTGDVAGKFTESGTITLFTIGGSLTVDGRITVLHTADPVAGLGNITKLTIGVDLAGIVSVSGTLTELTVGRNVSGRVTEAGTITLLTIGGSLTASGVIHAVNPVPTLGNIVTFTIGVDLAGTVLVSGALTTLHVGNDVSGTVTESGIINLLAIGGALTPSGRINAFNAADPLQVPAGVPATLGNINTMTVGRDLAGEVNVSGALGSLAVGTATFAGSITGTGKVTVQGTLTTLTVTGNIAGAVRESGTIATLTVGGSITSSGTITVLNTADPAQFTAGATLLGNIVTMAVTGDIAGLVTVSGNVTTLDAGSISGTVAVKSTLTTLRVVGNVSGTVSESGTINLLTIGGSLTGTGKILLAHTGDPAQFAPGAATFANIVTMSVTGDIAGLLSVTGNVTTLDAGNISGTVTVKNTLTTLRVVAHVSGQVTQSGTLNLLTIGGSLTSSGRITAANTVDPLQVPATAVTTHGNIVTFTIDGDLAGLVTVTGTLTTLTVGGNVSGTVFVQGQLTTMRVTGNVSGTVTQSGTITLLAIGGSLTSTGVINALNALDPLEVPLTPFTTIANITTMTVGGNFAGRVNVSGTFHTLNVTGNISGVVTVQGALKNLLVGGDVSGTVTETGTIDVLTIGGSLTVTGLIKAWNNAVASLGNLIALTIGQDFAGTILVSGNLRNFAILRGSMTVTGRLNVGSLDTMTIGPDQLSVGQNMAGIITVTGLLGSLRVAGGTPGTIIAGRINTLSVYGGFGPVVLHVIEAGITRKIELAAASSPYPLHDPNTTATNPYVNLQFFYESGTLANPQLTARITNGVSTARSQFDLSLITYHNTAKFNLARLDAVGTAGVRNVVIEGDLLTSVTAQAAAFFRSTPAALPAGVRLPVDDLAGVSIRDYAPNGFVQARTIMGVAFGSFTATNGRIGIGAEATHVEAGRLLTADTRIVQASDTFRVAFADQPAQRVGFFLATRPTGNFDAQNVALAVQGVVTVNAAGTANVTTPSNVARGAATALVAVNPPNTGNGAARDSVIETIAIRGDGASIDTRQWISRAITSTGPLGDLNLLSSQGITDVTAPSIFGSIISGGQITGTIQTTGQRTNPITSVVTTVPADLGRFYVIVTNKGPVVIASTIEARGGGITGQIISRGNLLSEITASGGLSGTIAVQGNLGGFHGTQRLGGLTAGGGLDGNVVILGHQIADVTINGGVKGGNYAVGGNVTGNLTLNGLEANSRLVVAGSIGDAALGTSLTASSNKGIIAALGSIRFTRGSPGGSVFANASANPTNAAALSAIFTQGGVALSVDGLAAIVADLKSLVVAAGGNLAGPTP